MRVRSCGFLAMGLVDITFKAIFRLPAPWENRFCTRYSFLNRGIAEITECSLEPATRMPAFCRLAMKPLFRIQLQEGSAVEMVL